MRKIRFTEHQIIGVLKKCLELKLGYLHGEPALKSRASRFSNAALISPQ